MTWSIIRKVLPRAGANSKLHQKKTKLQNVKLLPKTWVAPNNRLTISDQKFKILNLGIREQNEGTTKTQRQQMEMNIVTRKKETTISFREASKLKLSKLLQDSN